MLNIRVSSSITVGVIIIFILGGVTILALKDRVSESLELKPISSRQETVQLQSEAGTSTLRELKNAGRAVKPDLPLTKDKVYAIADDIVTEHYSQWKWRRPSISEKTHDELGAYWEAAYRGREHWWQLWRPNKPTLIITVHSKTRVYDAVEHQ